MSFETNIVICHRCPHRQASCAGKCACTIDGKDIVKHSKDGTCPKNWITAPGEPEPFKKHTFDWSLEGPNRWAELHDKCLAADLSTPDAITAFLARLNTFLDALPCGECKTHAKKYVAEHPPDTSSNRACWLWSVKFHNAVNVRLGKPIWTLPDYSNPNRE